MGLDAPPVEAEKRRGFVPQASRGGLRERERGEKYQSGRRDRVGQGLNKPKKARKNKTKNEKNLIPRAACPFWLCRCSRKKRIDTGLIRRRRVAVPGAGKDDALLLRRQGQTVETRCRLYEKAACRYRHHARHAGKIDTLRFAGNPGTHVLSDSGSTTAALQSFTIWGNVYIRNQDSLIVRTQKLWWIKGTRKVESDTFVQIETVKGDILRGKGLDAVEDFSHFSFKSQVSGQFPDFKRRAESNEEFLELKKRERAPTAGLADSRGRLIRILDRK